MEEFQGRAEAVNAIAQAALGILADAIDARGTAAIALSGGSTPRLYLTALFALDIDWSRVTLGLVDERFVPPDHADSNEGLVRSLASGTAATKAQLVGLWRGLESTEQDAHAASREADDTGLRFDLAFMGMGDDGHTASLFPGQPIAENGDDMWIGALPSPPATPQHARMTLTPRALLSCRHVFLVFSGENKKRVWETASSSEAADDYPVRVLNRHPALRVFVIA